MNPKKAAFLNLAVSIFFAAAIILFAALLKDTPYHQTVTGLLIALWWIPFAFLSCRGCTRCAHR